ncbi:unnamed protein product [Adineta ricciae]|nr:unnamed protein product [Adineta ricciae]
MIDLGSSPDIVAFLDQLENQVFDICSASTSKINEWRSKLDGKNNDMIETLKERNNIFSELSKTKESINKIIKCYNMSMKAASCTIARTIIEMIPREHPRKIPSVVANFMSDLISYVLSQVEQSGTETGGSMVFPMSGSGDRTYRVSIGTDRNMSKPVAGNEMASFLRDFVENSWNPASGTIALGLTCSYWFPPNPDKFALSVPIIRPEYKDDKLPIPDIADGQFNRSDALALASFYKLTLPNTEFEFVTNIVHFSADSTNLFNCMDSNNGLNMSTTMMNE